MATVIRDSVWGDIELNAGEIALIDLPEFQRLRRIRQLGFSDLVFPGANHTRFEHSLGVLHLARIALKRLVERGLEAEPEELAAVTAAALLHDIGHYPFSHTLEELEAGVLPSHTRLARNIICSERVEEVLRKWWGVEPAHVADYIDSGDSRHPVLAPIIDSGLDVDKLDYLIRDARGANVPYGSVDAQRLLACLTITGDGRELGLVSKGLPSVHSLIFAKHLMYATVYWHHACRSASVMLLRAVADLMGTGSHEASELVSLDDHGLITLLSASPTHTTRSLGERLAQRRLYKRAVEFAWGTDEFAELETYFVDADLRREFEDRLAVDAGAEAGDVLIDVPGHRPITLELAIVGRSGERDTLDTAGAPQLADVNRFQDSVRKARVFATDVSVAGRLRESYRL